MTKPSKTVRLFIATSLTAGVLAAVAGPAAAAHCTDSGGPGNSDFATHAQSASGPGGHNEGDHRGWSSCEERSANFSG